MQGLENFTAEISIEEQRQQNIHKAYDNYMNQLESTEGYRKMNEISENIYDALLQIEKTGITENSSHILIKELLEIEDPYYILTKRGNIGPKIELTGEGELALSNKPVDKLTYRAKKQLLQVYLDQ